MVGVGQDDGRIDLVEELLRGKSLHRGLSANGHENRRREDAMGGIKESSAGMGDGALGLDFKAHCNQV